MTSPIRRGLLPLTLSALLVASPGLVPVASAAPGEGWVAYVEQDLHRTLQTTFTVTGPVTLSIPGGSGNIMVLKADSGAFKLSNPNISVGDGIRLALGGDKAKSDLIKKAFFGSLDKIRSLPAHEVFDQEGPGHVRVTPYQGSWGPGVYLLGNDAANPEDAHIQVMIIPEKSNSSDPEVDPYYDDRDPSEKGSDGSSGSAGDTGDLGLVGILLPLGLVIAVIGALQGSFSA